MKTVKQTTLNLSSTLTSLPVNARDQKCQCKRSKLKQLRLNYIEKG